MLCDARSTPARVAVLLSHEGQDFYSDVAPPNEIMGALRQRSDNQIIVLEILSIFFGLPVIEQFICNRRVTTHSDNFGVEKCTEKGSCRTCNHGQGRSILAPRCTTAEFQAPRIYQTIHLERSTISWQRGRRSALAGREADRSAGELIWALAGRR
jgi:hypothetical protein